VPRTARGRNGTDDGAAHRPCRQHNCAFCRYNLPFDLPQHIVDAAEEGRLVIFAGAGISTENRLVFPDLFVETVASELPKPRVNMSFAATMSAFTEQPDGKSLLLLKIRDRLDYVRSHPELYWSATRFHKELATVWQLQEIITTNWDDFFERECGAVPFITDKDLAFWSQRGRKVLKLHGSVHSLGEMVVTTADYERCYERLATGILGSRLKSLLANRTVVFAGYSLSDPDLHGILEILTRDMGELRPTYYIVTPETRPAATERWRDIRHLKTDGTHFLRTLKTALWRFRHNLPDSRLDRVDKVSDQVRRAHRMLFRKRPLQKYPETLLCASYQDGLRHSLDRISTLARTGQYSHKCALVRKYQRYERIRKRHVRRKSYLDAAYTEGYQNGMLLLLDDGDTWKHMPFYFVFGADAQPLNFAAYSRLAAKAQRLHRGAFAQAKQVAQKAGAGVELHHTPFLDTYVPEDDDDAAPVNDA
jgi:SIR2-like protein